MSSELTVEPPADNKLRAWIHFSIALVLFGAAWCAYRFWGVDQPYILWGLATILILFSLPAFSVFLEISLFPLLYLVVAAFYPLEGAWVSFPWVVATLVILAHGLSSRLAMVLLTLCALLWLDMPAVIESPPTVWVAWGFIATGLLGLVLFLVTARDATSHKVSSIDLLLCSYSGNTAHFARCFSETVEQMGVEVMEHRFHFHERFDAEFTGDALVIAYPVAGWNPFWPMLEYLLFKLPSGKGKAAFILYTSAGGPENATIVPWLVLRLKGYRVMGRLGATYPVNVPIFRLFSSSAWRIFDGFLPRQSDLKTARKAAAAFCEGRRSGLGLTVVPSPLFILGPLTYNRFVNYIYRSYSFKRLCNNCGRCIRFCPTERLYMKNGRVRSKGTCALCFGCVNICPTQAVHLLFFSEWGNVYRPRWPKYVVKGKPKASVSQSGMSDNGV